MKSNFLKYFVLFYFILLIPLYPANNSQKLFNQGMEAFNSGNYGSSELLFRKIIDQEEDDDLRDKAWYYLCRSVFEKKKYDAAIFEFNTFLNRCRTTDICNESRFWMGESYFFLKDYSRAIEQYKRYIKKSRKGKLVSVSHDRIGSIYYFQKRYDEAIIEWTAAIKKSNIKLENAVRIYNIGHALFKKGKYDEAMNRLNPLLTSNAGKELTSKVRLIIGQIYQIEENYQKALVVLNGIPLTLLKESPYNEAQYFKAISYLKQKNFTAAKTLLDLFVIIGKDSQWHYDALYELGKILAMEGGGDVKLGISHLEKVKKNSKKPLLVVKTSKFLSQYYLETDVEKSIPYLLESISDDNPEKENKELMILLGKAYIKIEDFNKADDVLKDYLKKYPYDSKVDDVTFMRARIYLEKGDIEEAMELFQSIKKNNPFSKFIAESNYYLAHVNYQKKQYKEAIALLNKYLKQKGIHNKYDAYVLLSNIYIDTKNDKKADETINYLIKSYGNGKGLEDVLYKYIIMLYESGLNYNRHYLILVRKFPRSKVTMNLYLYFGNDYYAKKKYKKAEYYYAKYLSGNVGDRRGEAFFNRLFTLYYMEKYFDIIGIVKNGKLPPMNENQWAEIPLLLSRCYYKLQLYSKTYNIMKNSETSLLSDHDLLLFIISSISVEDINSAQEYSKLLEKRKTPNKELYAESLYHIGSYLVQKENIDDAKGYFSRIIIECPSSKYVNRAKISIAELYIMTKNYKDSIAILNEIKDKSMRNLKTSLLVYLYFSNGEEKKAIAMTKKNLTKLAQSKDGEMAFKSNMEYYYSKKNLNQFKIYSNYLKKYSDHLPFIYYLSGKLYYEKGYYKSSYYFFYKLYKDNKMYMDETCYYLGNISLFVKYDRKSAFRYYYKLTQMESTNIQLKYRSILNLALIMKEINRKDESKKYLMKIIDSDQRGDVKNQALNLYELFGFSESKSNPMRNR